jgi:hypothetical protein
MVTTITTTTTTTIFSLQSWFASCRKKCAMFLLGLHNLEVSQCRHVRQCNQSFSHSVTLPLTLCQTSRLDFEPLMGPTANEYWVSQMKHQLDATLCRVYFCRVTLHVSGTSAHHQEYLKLVQRPLVHVLSLQVSHHISLLGPELSTE